jgi:cytochrome oxidase Cu insertion factor (SCO1/SenC/PrrC family)
MLPGMREADGTEEAAAVRPAPVPAGASPRGMRAFWVSLAAIVLAGAAVITVVAVVHAGSGPQLARPTGIPASVSDAQINLMGLSPVPVRPAPGFTLTDQDGRTLSLASLRGKVVVLEFMDPHCTDICPIVSQEYVDAYRDLGPLAGKVVFAAVNVNQYHAGVADMMAYSREQRLTAIPGWHFFTGPVPDLAQGLGRLRDLGGGAQPRRRHRAYLRRLLHRPGRPGAVRRRPHGRPHILRLLLPARRADHRLGTGHRPGRPDAGPLSTAGPESQGNGNPPSRPARPPRSWASSWRW